MVTAVIFRVIVMMTRSECRDGWTSWVDYESRKRKVKCGRVMISV